MKAVNADRRRTTKIHRRGNFLDPGAEVQASLPAAFLFTSASPGSATATDTTPIDRHAVAHWLMHRDNTLTPRVWTNRIWARLFGIGIVETEEDFGALGSLPSNPELLDYLAAEYRDSGWSLKKLLKAILMSKAYQQSSVTTAELRNADPRNVLNSRGSRFRLPAEVIRDQALAVSGLLSLKKGGPPVMPPQPDGLWRSTYNGLKWVNAEGEDRYRRALYTYLKRTTPYPSMITFDGGSGEVCQIRRIRTKTSYRLAQPKDLRVGTKIRCTAGWDNSVQNAELMELVNDTGNPNNFRYSPTNFVHFNQQIWDEMFIGYFNYSVIP